MKDIILALDQGTSSSRAIAFDAGGRKVAESRKEFPQYFPGDGRVEHVPEEIWASQSEVMLEVARAVGVENIAAIGITNQRETTIVWDAETGEPVCNAIVWQDRRTTRYCNFLTEHGYAGMVKHLTGLKIDPYFSGTKVKWILDNVPGARQKANAGRLRFGTVDTYLLWRLTCGKVHATDVSNASRTMLFNIHKLQWDKEMLQLMDIPESLLPEVCASSHVYGYAEIDGQRIPVAGMIGDQQSALFGQQCVTEGAVKNTYGTGCFLLMNTGSTPVVSGNNLLTTVAWQIDGITTYALEGSIFVAGAAVQWLRDSLGIIRESSEVEELARKVPDNGGVYFVPALTGLGAPYWKPEARGTIVGLNRGSTAAHIARATLEGIAFQVSDVVKSMQTDAGIPLCELKVDGGASANNLLMQIQADILGSTVLRPMEKETTALGAALMAGLAAGLWKNCGELKGLWQQERRFIADMSPERRAELEDGWRRAVKSSLVQQDK